MLDDTNVDGRSVMRVSVVLSIGAAVVFASSNASAQGRGQFGVTMGYPAAVGVTWHATERIGIKADVNFSLASSEIDAGPVLPERETNTNSLGFGVAGLFYASRNDNLSVYFSPRFAYATTTLEIEGDDPIAFSVVLPIQIPIPAPSLDPRTESSSYSVAGSFGAQYSPIRRFSVFGEVGLHYTSQHSEAPFSVLSETDGAAFGVRSAIGIVLYLN
jgi:hypothetical protein